VAAEVCSATYLKWRPRLKNIGSYAKTSIVNFRAILRGPAMSATGPSRDDRLIRGETRSDQDRGQRQEGGRRSRGSPARPPRRVLRGMDTPLMGSPRSARRSQCFLRGNGSRNTK
jgi:hypothetical protein